MPMFGDSQQEEVDSTHKVPTMVKSEPGDSRSVAPLFQLDNQSMQLQPQYPIVSSAASYDYFLNGKPSMHPHLINLNLTMALFRPTLQLEPTLLQSIQASHPCHMHLYAGPDKLQALGKVEERKPRGPGPLDQATRTNHGFKDSCLPPVSTANPQVSHHSQA